MSSEKYARVPTNIRVKNRDSEEHKLSYKRDFKDEADLAGYVVKGIKPDGIQDVNQQGRELERIKKGESASLLQEKGVKYDLKEPEFTSA